jgi:hypothetical protein
MAASSLDNAVPCVAEQVAAHSPDGYIVLNDEHVCGAGWHARVVPCLSWQNSLVAGASLRGRRHPRQVASLLQRELRSA